MFRMSYESHFEQFLNLACCFVCFSIQSIRRLIAEIHQPVKTEARSGTVDTKNAAFHGIHENVCT